MEACFTCRKGMLPSTVSSADKQIPERRRPRPRATAQPCKRKRHAADDQATLFKARIFFWLIGVTEGHAKNFTIFLVPGRRFRLIHFTMCLLRNRVSTAATFSSSR